MKRVKIDKRGKRSFQQIARRYQKSYIKRNTLMKVCRSWSKYATKRNSECRGVFNAIELMEQYR